MGYRLHEITAYRNKHQLFADRHEAGLILAERELQIAQLEVARDVTVAYAAFVAAVRNTEVERDRLRLAGEVVSATRARMTAGRDPLVELRRAEVAEANARLAADRAERETGTTRRALATALGAPTIDAVADNAWFESIGSAPTVVRAEADNPDIARLQAEVARNRATLAAERASALPNPTVRAGVRQFQDTRDTAAVLGFAVPIPVLNSNRAAIERAGFDLARSEAEAAQSALTFNARLADALQRQDLAWREASSIRRVVLPAAQETQALAREGYVSGRFNLIEALDAQRTLTDARLQYNAALQEFHTRKAEAERLSGRTSGTTTRPGAVTR
jgi:cobalt-zinc-cadmium efflux system outer membrane protein